MNENKVENGLGFDLDHQDLSDTSRCSSLWIEGAGICSLHHETLKSPGPGDVIVKTLYSGISRGTETLVFNGLVPESEFERMRGPHMAGDFSFPLKYGYACVGSVVTGPENLVGKTVFCLHPHQDRFTVSAENISILPEALPPERAVLAANMETALNIVWDAVIQPGDRVAVFGAGVVGSLVANLCSRIPGTEIGLIDSNPDRKHLAEKLGLSFFDAEAVDGEFDVLINASASPAALASALDHAAMEARIVEASWYGDRVVSIPLGGAFHARRLSLVSSQVGAISATRARRWTFSRRMAKALELLLDPHLDHLISGETDFYEIVDAYPRILSSKDTLCHRIRYQPRNPHVRS